MTPAAPPRPRNTSGDLRKVGIELEYSGIPPETMARTVAECFGGSVRKENRYLFHVRDTSLGDFAVELDALLFKELKVRDYFKKLGAGELAADLEELAAGVAETVVPWEVVSEPVPYPKLPEFDRLRFAAWKAGGEGTGASPLYAFGLHLNPEVPDTETSTLLSFLRSFILLYDYLAEAMNLDATRALSPFVDPFPEDYAEAILSPGYRPDRDTFIRDYISHNDRNRPLDLLPVLAWVNEGLVRELLPREKILRRPAFHYRLPDSRIGDQGWSVTGEWNRWIEVEQLASDPPRLSMISESYLQQGPPSLRERTGLWLRRIKELLS